MNNAADLKELLKLTTSQIKELNKAQMKIQHIVEQQQETVAYVKEEIKEQEAQGILDGCDE